MIIAITLVLIAGLIYYWKEYRPHEIEHNCSYIEKYSKEDSSESARFWHEKAGEQQYEHCVRENGL